MAEFRVVDYRSLPEEMKQEALRRSYSVYSGADTPGPYAKEFMEFTEKNCGIRCMMQDGKLVGVVTFREKKSGLMLDEVWAKPSREFLLKNGMTIGRKLTLVVQGMARKKGMKFEISGFIGAGKRFGVRLRGELHYTPKRLGGKRKAVLQRRRNQPRFP